MTFRIWRIDTPFVRFCLPTEWLLRFAVLRKEFATFYFTSAKAVGYGFWVQKKRQRYAECRRNITGSS